MANTKAKKVITAVQVVLLILVLAGAGWLVYKAVTYNQAQQPYRDIQVAYANDSSNGSLTCPVDLNELCKNNPAVVGWIQMDDVDISYPIVKGSDNEHYLHYDVNDNPSIDGAIFLDYRNKSIEDDLHVLIYGHNMLDESMFGQLDSYLDKSFFDNGKKTFTIFTPEKALRYEIFSVTVVDPTDDTYQVGFTNAKVFDAFVKDLQGHSNFETNVDVTGKDHVVTLSTCSASDRLVVSAKRVSEQPWTA